jgi:uncharacterized protein
MTSINTSTRPNGQALKFFLLVFALSIPLWIIEIFIDLKRSQLDFSILDILAAFTPLLAACILVYKEEGRSGVIRLLKRIFDFPRITRKIWYVPIILLPLLIYFLIYIILHFIELPLPDSLNIPFKSIPFLFILFFIGAICEEVGYIGYAIEPMQKRFGVLSASILIGIVWALWHYPSIIQQGHNFYWMIWATLGTIAVRVLIVWIFNNTGKSLFACILFHTILNLGRPLFPKDETHNPLVDYPEIHYSVIVVITVIILFVWRGKNVIRENYHTNYPPSTFRL